MEEQNKFETEIDFKSLPKSPSRMFGWIFPYYLVLFLIVGIFFVKNMDFASNNSVPANYTDSLQIDVNVDVKKGGIMPAIDLGIITNPTAEIVEGGKKLYITNCSSCHGNEGKGDGVAAVALNPPPRDFYSEEDWKNGKDFNAMYKTLQEGIAGGGMIAYEFLPIEDRISIIHYIRSLGSFPEITEESSAQLDNTYELSKGVNTPNNITLEMAVDKISSESGSLVNTASLVLEKINSSNNPSAVLLFNNFVENKEQAIAIFKRDFVNNKNADEFINRIISFPSESGFKSNISLLSKDDLEELFNLINEAAS